MSLADKIAELAGGLVPSTGADVLEMREDIFYYFSQLDDFEVLRVEQNNEEDKMVLAVCLSTMADPFFKIVVAHTWQRDLAYDNEWHEFDVTDMGTVFRFLTWEDDAYISGEIWFERAKKPEL